MSFSKFYISHHGLLPFAAVKKCTQLACNLYTVFTNSGHGGKNWCLVMKARRCRINKNCKWRLSGSFSELAECWARIPPKITLYGRLLNTITWDVFSLEVLVLISCLQRKGTRICSRKRDYFEGFRSIRSWTSGRCLQKSGKHVSPNFTFKPNAKASSLQFCKTEIKTDIDGKKKRNKRRIYGLLVNGRDLCHYTKQVKSRWKKERGWKIHSRVKRRKMCYKLMYV